MKGENSGCKKKHILFLSDSSRFTTET
uniref:Uncharacterized protein n=1 Tax=Arundo donax TaxID=35708 RepID=A0A0A9H6L9_ARUDO